MIFFHASVLLLCYFPAESGRQLGLGQRRCRLSCHPGIAAEPGAGIVMEQASHYLLWEWLSVAKQLAGHLQRQEIRPRAAWHSLGAKGLSVGARGRVFEPPPSAYIPCTLVFCAPAQGCSHRRAELCTGGGLRMAGALLLPRGTHPAPLGSSHRWVFILGSGIEMAEVELGSEGRTLQRRRRPPGDAPREPCASMAPGAGSPPASC